MIIHFNDAYFRALLRERLRLQQELAPILTRAGGSNKNRVEINRRRAQQRKELRRKLKFNAFHMAAHLSEHAQDGSLPESMRDALHAYVYGENQVGVSDEQLNRMVEQMNRIRNSP